MTTTKELYDLEIDDVIRFRVINGEGHTWNPGTVKGLNKDLSLNVHCGYTGGMRAIGLNLKQVQKKVKGPKGGTKWVDVECLESNDT